MARARREIEDREAAAAAAVSRAATPDRFVLRDQPGHLLRLCQQRAVELFVAEVGEGGPTPRQFAVLVTVAEAPGLSQTELVRRTGIDRSTLAEMLRRMIARGWLARTRTAHDRRSNALALTETGAAVAQGVREAVLRAQARILAPVPPERRGELIALLRLLADGEGSAADGAARRG